MTPQQKKLVIFVLSGIFGILVIASIALAIFQSQQGKVTYTSLPGDITLRLDGKDIPTNGTMFVAQGKHEFIATRRAFDEKKIPFEIAKGETKNFDIYIFPNGDAGLDWVEQNPGEASALDGIVSNEYNNRATSVRDNNPILEILPIIDGSFRIDQGLSKTGKDFALYVQFGNEESKNAALATLRYFGYDPENFEIIYVDARNPSVQ